MEFQPQQTFGNYRILRRLGKGGMGAVYEVEHIRLGTHYALKAFTLDHGDNQFLRERFLAEGKVLARLHHPGLVRVYDLDFDPETNTPYFVMDLVLYKDGEPHTLADVDEGGADEATLVAWFRELLDALNYVHAQGIVHRDVKLNNILLSADRRVMLSDFGVARFFGEEVRRRIGVESTMQMSSGERLVMGTAHYLAPEVNEGYEATPAADLYALGVTFFHLLTGMWYEPSETARRLLDDFEYDWSGALLPLLDEDPEQRVAKIPVLRSDAGGDGAPPLPETTSGGGGTPPLPETTSGGDGAPPLPGGSRSCATATATAPSTVPHALPARRSLGEGWSRAALIGLAIGAAAVVAVVVAWLAFSRNQASDDDWSFEAAYAIPESVK